MNAEIFFEEGDPITLSQHLKFTQTEYLYCLGASNGDEPGIDLALVGLLQKVNE